MNEAYTEFSPEIIEALKASGYNSLQIAPIDDKASNHTIIELIPVISSEFQLDIISLDASIIEMFIGRQSPMARYLVNKAFLPDGFFV